MNHLVGHWYIHFLEIKGNVIHYLMCKAINFSITAPQTQREADKVMHVALCKSLLIINRLPSFLNSKDISTKNIRF